MTDELVFRCVKGRLYRYPFAYIKYIGYLLRCGDLQKAMKGAELIEEAFAYFSNNNALDPVQRLHPRGDKPQQGIHGVQRCEENGILHFGLQSCLGQAIHDHAARAGIYVRLSQCFLSIIPRGHSRTADYAASEFQNFQP